MQVRVTVRESALARSIARGAPRTQGYFGKVCRVLNAGGLAGT